jgi:CRISPR type III-B/RAMP module-associated protein Cmr3
MQYLLTLKPLKPYFFGGDQALSDNEYYAVSRYLPYPTQFFGALRLYLAERARLITVHRNGKYANKNNADTVQKLLGDPYKDGTMGAIRSLSPMFVVSDSLEDAWFPTPFDFLYDRQSDQKVSTKIYRYETIDTYPFLEGYNVKNYNPQRLGSRDFWDKYIDGKVPIATETLGYDEVFVPHRQTGIALNRKKVVDTMFYVKTSYSLAKGFSLGIIVDIDDSIPHATIQNGVITLGAEGSLFGLEAYPIEALSTLNTHPVIAQILTPPTQTGTPSKAIAIAPAIFTGHAISDIASFAIVPHFEVQRMLKSNGSDKQSYHRFKGKTDPKRLVPPGSVLYDPGDQLPQAPGVFGHIGYNTFITAQGV